MEELKKISTPLSKQCRLCGQVKSVVEFCPTRWMKDGYRNECRKCKYIYYTKPYLHGEVGKETVRRCEKSSKVKDRRLEYRLSEHGKAIRSRDYKTWASKNKLRRQAINLKHFHSQKYKDTRQRYYPRSLESNKRRYHQIQDAAGFHGYPRDFELGYRVIKALETAPVVEIEG